MSRDAGCRSDLVHDPAADPGEPMLGFLCGAGQRQWLGCRACRNSQRPPDRDAQRCGGGKTGSARDCSCDYQVGAGDG